MTEEIIVLASGSKTGGGSGFEKLVEHFNFDDKPVRVVGVVSNVLGGGVESRAARLGIPFMHLPNADCTVEGYRRIAPCFGVSNPWYACSGWLRLVLGLPYGRGFNIHPALLCVLNGRFGGPGKYGHFVHEDVKRAFDEGLIDHSGFTMHFLGDEYDRGRAFAESWVKIHADMSPDDIAALVNAEEHLLQPMLTELVVTGQIRLEGDRLIVPKGYEYLPFSS